MGKVCLNQANPRDLVALKNSLRQIPSLISALQKSAQAQLLELAAGLDPLTEVAETIQRALLDEPSPVARDKEGRMIRPGYDPHLDQYLKVSQEGKQWIAALEAQEKANRNCFSQGGL